MTSGAFSLVVMRVLAVAQYNPHVGAALVGTARYASTIRVT